MKYVIAGYGRFGKIAVERLGSAFPRATIMVMDPKGFAELEFGLASVTAIQADAVSVLRDSTTVDDEDVIVPMVPFHLAAAYVLAKRPSVRETALPDFVAAIAPNPFRLNVSTLACSWADFLCPDDCPEGELCTVTGQPRDEPLYAFLARLAVPGFEMHVQRSHQILPGVGGYTAAELRDLERRINPTACIIATACRCHGILTAVQAG